MAIDESYPCPRCGEYRLTFDGMLAWRSGPRPLRIWARKEMPACPRAEYERERCYHCAACGAEFFEDVESEHRPHLFAEQGRPALYIYDRNRKRWQAADEEAVKVYPHDAKRLMNPRDPLSDSGERTGET